MSIPRKSRRQLHSASGVRKRWSLEGHSLSDDSVYSMDISSDDELQLNDLNLKDKIKYLILLIFMNFVKLTAICAI